MTTFKAIGAIALLATLGACATPQESLEHAQNRCEFIGYDIERERVPTLQCTERKFDAHQGRGRSTVTGIVVGVATVATAGAIQ